PPLLFTLLARSHTHTLSLHDALPIFGPKAGISGGRVIYSGPVYGLADVEESITARFVNAPPLQLKDTPSREATGTLQLEGVNARTIEDLDVEFPLGQLTAVSGVSGSGKTTLVSHVLGTIVGKSGSTNVCDGRSEAL